MGVLERLDRRNQRIVDGQIERDARRLAPPGVVAIVSGASLVWIAFWCVMAVLGGGVGWAAVFAVVGLAMGLVLLRDVIADVRDLRARRRARVGGPTAP